MNERYKAAITAERRLFELLENSLNKEQREALMAYSNAASDTPEYKSNRSARHSQSRSCAAFPLLRS